MQVDVRVSQDVLDVFDAVVAEGVRGNTGNPLSLAMRFADAMRPMVLPGISPEATFDARLRAAS